MTLGGPVLAVREESKYLWLRAQLPAPAPLSAVGFLSSAMLRAVLLHLMPTFFQVVCMQKGAGGDLLHLEGGFLRSKREGMWEGEGRAKRSRMWFYSVCPGN